MHGAEPCYGAQLALLADLCCLLPATSCAVGITPLTAPALPPAPAMPPADEQLYKDIEAVLDECFKDGLTALAKAQPGGAPLQDPALLQPLLLLWDGICSLFAGRAKPSSWVAHLMRVAKLFTPEAREAAAAAVAEHVSSGPMLTARPLWRELKPVPLKPLFESADVGGGGGSAGGSGPGERAATRQRA